MPISVPFVDLLRIHQPLATEFGDVLQKAVASSAFVMGAAVSRFEADFAEYCGARHCVGAATGTDALLLALRAAGIGPGDEVITVPNTFMATVEAILLAGARPVFVDVDESTQLMAISRVEPAIGPRTRAIVPVHLFGQPADMDPLLEIANRRGLKVIEDACQAHGAVYRGRRVGGLASLATCFSFYPGKNLGALGEGGAVTTNDATLAERMRVLRDHGSREKYLHAELGWNARLHALQAGFLSVKLPHLDGWNRSRRQAAARYDRQLAGLKGVKPVARAAGTEPVYHLYVVRVTDRKGCQAFLKEQGVGTGIHYPVPVHLQEACRGLGHAAGAFPVAERLAGEILSLPMFAGITDTEVDRVCEVLGAWARRA